MVRVYDVLVTPAMSLCYEHDGPGKFGGLLYLSFQQIANFSEPQNFNVVEKQNVAIANSLF